MYCDHCGEELTAAPAAERTGDGHAACARARDLEPPRYCSQCRRRMVVQVTPLGWTARCSAHGTSTG
ncbi:MAG TPA: hypothetical protein VIJ54_00520 [Actinomycetes bacterium]